nr:PREDICTED: zinc finger protein ZXDC isoform X2 [Lepisosteus oculatus]
MFVGGGDFVCFCYRDTKMEIQGLFAAQNIHQQHGVSCRTDQPQPTTVKNVFRHSSSTDWGKEQESHQPEDGNKRPGTSPFRLQAENGSGFVSSPRHNLTVNTSAPTYAAIGLRNVSNLQSSGGKEQDGREAGLKGDFEIEESGLYLAFPVLLSEECGSQQPPPQPQVLRQLQDGATLPQPLMCESAAALNPSSKENEEFYVVFNIVQDGESSSCKENGRSLALTRETEDSPKGTKDAVMETQACTIAPEEKMPNPASPRKSFAPLNLSCNNEGSCEVERGTGVNAKGRLGFGYDSGVISVMANANKGNPPYQASDKSEQHAAGDFPQPPSRSHDLISDAAAFTDTVPLNDRPCQAGVENGQDGVPDFPGPHNGGGGSPDESFSGTIMINNQSIIVTIENGVLTLATPPSSGHHRDDAFVNLKEQLGMKDSQDIVLINYDNAAKTSDKAPGRHNAPGVSSAQFEETRPSLSVTDSGLGLNGDCSISDPNSTLDSCGSGKDQDERTLCPLDETDIVCPDSRDGQQGCYVVTDSGELQMKLGDGRSMMSKKGVLVMYHCTQLNCSKTFDTKHKLKIHLLSHTEDQRPFKCTVEGCGWSFTTSYKLKRHLQSHDKVRPFTCEWENCGRKFTTVYNLKAHIKSHDQENTFACEICSERFRTATKLSNHQRTHFEPERPHKCEFPGCEKTFITFSALYSHNRTHFREIGQFSCTYPGCDKRYDKACRLKIHMRSHTGERPFVCDFEGCGWSFTSMSKLLRHKRKHDDDRRFTCKEEGCGKSFTRAEHLKGHSITHLGTKPFECQVEGCCAKFSARSSLYIHSKKHLQDVETLKTLCLVSSCNKQFTSKSSMKSHMVKHHNFSPDLLNQLEMSSSLTPSNELTSSGQGDLGNIDITSLFSSVPTSNPGIAMDMSLVNSGILTIDAASVGATLGGSIAVNNTPLAQAVDPLILTAGGDITHGLDSSLAMGSNSGVLPQGTLNLEDVQTVNPEALGSLAALSMRTPSQDPLQGLGSSSTLTIDTATLTPSSSLAASHVPELLTPTKVDRSLLSGSDVIGQQEGSKVVTQFVFSSPTGSYSAQRDVELNAVSGSTFLESGGSARTDYRAIQLAKKKKKQKGSGCSPGGPSSSQRKCKSGKGSSATVPAASPSGRFSEGVVSPSGGLTIRDTATGAQYVQIQLLQDDPAGDGDLAFQLSSQTSTSHSQLTVDLPVNILQEPHTSAEDDAGSDNSQFTGSTINLQDLE